MIPIAVIVIVCLACYLTNNRLEDIKGLSAGKKIILALSTPSSMWLIPALAKNDITPPGLEVPIFIAYWISMAYVLKSFISEEHTWIYTMRLQIYMILRAASPFLVILMLIKIGMALAP